MGEHRLLGVGPSNGEGQREEPRSVQGLIAVWEMGGFEIFDRAAQPSESGA